MHFGGSNPPTPASNLEAGKMETYSLGINRREPGKKGVKACRKEGLLPVVVYGPGIKETFSGSLERKEVIKLLSTPKGRNMVFTVDGECGKINVIPYVFDIDPVKDMIRHIDLLAIREEDEVEVNVPVMTTGRSKGEVLGGKLLQVLKEVKVSCRPDAIPEKIVVDVTSFVIGSRLKISQIAYPEGVTPVYKQDAPVIVLNKGRGQVTAGAGHADDED